MLDPYTRALLARPLDRLTAALDRTPVTPDRLTVAGLVLGLAGSAAAAAALWPVALVMWLASRLADGLDGPLARRRRAGHPDPADVGAAAAGGFLDISADFVVYGAFVVGVAVGTQGTSGGLLPFLAVLLAYYVNGSAFLAFSSVAERTGHRIDDGRSLSFLGGLAEGTETVAVHCLWCLLPSAAGSVAWVWAGVVAVSAAQRVVGGYRTLSAPPPG